VTGLRVVEGVKEQYSSVIKVDFRLALETLKFEFQAVVVVIAEVVVVVVVLKELNHVEVREVVVTATAVSFLTRQNPQPCDSISTLASP
jgi:hypothetical protein